MNSEGIDWIKQHGKRSKGKKDLIKYLEGGKLDLGWVTNEPIP